MDIRMRVVVVMACLTLTSYVYGMQWGYRQGLSEIKVYTLTGLGGYKQEEQRMQHEYAQMLFHNDKTNVTITPIITPLEHSDLGQTQTMNYISSAFAADKERDKKRYDGRIILASSQAAAAIIKLLSQRKLEMPDLKGVFFEGLFMSGNDAIYYSIHGERPEDYEPLRERPCVRWWAPYLAKMLSIHHYRPEGDQPIHALPDVPQDLPIAIIHGKEDQRVRHDDAMVLYSWLQQNGKKNLYLLSKAAGPDTIANSRDHVNVLTRDDVPKVQALLRKFGILPSTLTNTQHDEALLSALQPKLSREDIERYTQLYNEIHERHKMHEDIAQGVNMAQEAAKIAAGAAVVYTVVKMLTRNRSHAAQAAATLSVLNPELLMAIVAMAELA